MAATSCVSDAPELLGQGLLDLLRGSSSVEFFGDSIDNECRGRNADVHLSRLIGRVPALSVHANSEGATRSSRWDRLRDLLFLTVQS